VSRLKQLRALQAGIRRAYAMRLATVRAARERADHPDGALATAETEPVEPEPPEPPPAPPPSVDESVPRSLRIAGAWSWRLILIAVVAWGLLWIVDRFLFLVTPMMVGLLLAGLLAPAYRQVLRLNVNRSLATLLVLVTGLALVGGTLTLVVNQLIQGFPDMQRSAAQGVADIEDWLHGPPLNLTDAELEELVDQGSAWVEQNTQSLIEGGLSAVTGTVQFLTGFVLSLLACFFFLRDGRRIWNFLVGMLPARARAPMDYAGDGAWRTLGGYVRGTVLIALIDAIGIGVGLWILRVPFALPLAALVFIGSFVPIIGSFISGTVAVLVALVDAPEPGVLDGGGLVKALMVLGVVILVQQVEGHVLQPVIMSRAVDIHPLAVVIAVTGGAILAGLIGALVAVPVVAVLNTVIRRLNHYHHRRLLEAGAAPDEHPPEERPVAAVGSPAAATPQ
jgi:predicted PurR-regulated permease PerM